MGELASCGQRPQHVRPDAVRQDDDGQVRIGRCRQESPLSRGARADYAAVHSKASQMVELRLGVQVPGEHRPELRLLPAAAAAN